MKLAGLQKKVAEVLGVSSSQKELSFEIFIDSISEILDEAITLKVPRIGFFQKKAFSAKDEVQPLIFSPLSVDLANDAKNLYLTIDVSPKTKATVEFDSHVFSIGVGKPLLPLTLDDMPDTETSYAMLKKSIEERVKELIIESDQIPNFNIWDDYYKSPEKYSEENIEDVQSQLAELTSDLHFKEQEDPKNIPQILFEDNDTSLKKIEQDKKQKPVETEDKFSDLHEIIKQERDNIFNITDNEFEADSGLDTTGKEQLSDYSSLETMEIPIGSLTIADLLEDSSSEQEGKSTSVENDKVQQTVEEQKTIYELPEEIPQQESISSDETIFKKISVEKEEPQEKIIEEKEESGDEEEKEIKLEQEEDRIEWNWGDDLKEEFGIDTEEEADFELMDNLEEEDNLKLIDEKIGTDKKFTKDLFKQLERTLEREIAAEDERFDNNEYHYDNRKTRERLFKFKNPTGEQPERPKKVILEFSGPPVKYEFVEDRRLEKEKRMAITLVNEDRDRFYDPYEKPRFKPIREEKEKYFNKTFLIIFSAFIVVTAVIIFFIMKANNPTQLQTNAEITNPSRSSETINDSYKSETQIQNSQDQTYTSPKNNSVSQKLNEELSDFPISSTPPVPIKNETSVPIQGTVPQTNNQTSQTNNGIYRNIAADTRVGGSIYYDGKTYNYQISSWRNKQKAEQEVRRLRSLGFTAFILEAYLPQKGGTWYRVRVGSFGSEKEAQDFISKNKF